MDNIVSWPDAWSCLKLFFEDLARQLRACDGRLWHTIECHASPASPLSAYLSLGHGSVQNDEELVLTWVVSICGASLRASADIARGDGLILAQATQSTLTAEPPDWRGIAEALHGAVEFFRANTKLIQDELLPLPLNRREEARLGAFASDHDAVRNFYVYVASSKLEPVSAVIMYNAQDDEVLSG